MPDPKYALIATVGTNDFRLPDSLLNYPGQECLVKLQKSNLPALVGKQYLDATNYNRILETVRDIERIPNHARQWGELFLKEYEKKPSIISELGPDNFLILKKLAELATEDAAQTLICPYVTRFILFATDTTPENRKQDTYAYAQIIKQFLPVAFPTLLENCLPDDIHIVKLTDSPERYRKMETEVRRAFDNATFLQDLGEEGRFDKIFLLPTAGTPAMTMAVMQCCLENPNIRDILEPLYASEFGE